METLICFRNGQWGVVVGVTEVLMLLSLVLVTLRGDTNALCSLDLENITLVPPEYV